MKYKRLTLSIPTAGLIAGIGRNASYEAARKGEIPTLKFGRRKVVPIPALERLLGLRPGELGPNSDFGAGHEANLAEEARLAEEAEERRRRRKHKPHPRRRPANATD
jgi:hypothetical protein